MSIFSPFLIVCYDQDEVDAAVTLARALGYPDAQLAVGSLQAGIDALHQRTNSPEYILLDIGKRGPDVLPDLDELALHCEGDVRVVVIGSINDIVFYRDLKARGVVEYFPRPASAADIRPVLQQSKTRQQIQQTEGAKEGTVISVMSAASGDGATTMAINLAYTLAVDYKQPTVLIDMDYQFGLISKSLDLTASFGIRELFDHPERGLDEMLVNKMLVNYRDKLNIIAAPSELRLMPMIRPETVRELVSIMRSQFAFVIIDVPHVWTDWTAATLTYSDHSIMVAQLWLRSLTHASRLLTAWHNIGVAQENVSVAINRSGAKFKEAITAQDFERICRHKIAAHVNNDIKAVAQAENEAKTLFEINAPAGILQQQLRQFGGVLCKRYRPEAVADDRQVGTGKKSLKTLLKK